MHQTSLSTGKFIDLFMDVRRVIIEYTTLTILSHVQRS